MSESVQRLQWLDQARLGSAPAVSKLLTAYHPILRARAETKLDPDLRARIEPDDILQDVYFQVLRCIGQFEGDSPKSFLNWVLTILDNKLISTRQALCRQKRDIARDVRPQSPAGTESHWNLLEQLQIDSYTPSRFVRREEAVTALQACLKHLSESHRRVVELRFLEGCSVEEAAERLGITKTAVVALTRRALDSLRASMERLGEFTRAS